MRKVTLGEYRNLMHAFVSGLIRAGDFKSQYLGLVEQDDARRLPEISQILGSVEQGLDKPDVRAVVTVALRKLDAVKHRM